MQCIWLLADAKRTKSTLNRIQSNPISLLKGRDIFLNFIIMSKIDPIMIDEFKQIADEKIENIKQTLKDKGIDEKDINWFIDTMNQAINDTIKQKENEQNRPT